MMEETALMLESAFELRNILQHRSQVHQIKKSQRNSSKCLSSGLSRKKSMESLPMISSLESSQPEKTMVEIIQSEDLELPVLSPQEPKQKHHGGPKAPRRSSREIAVPGRLSTNDAWAKPRMDDSTFPAVKEDNSGFERKGSAFSLDSSDDEDEEEDNIEHIIPKKPSNKQKLVLKRRVRKLQVLREELDCPPEISKKGALEALASKVHRTRRGKKKQTPEKNLIVFVGNKEPSSRLSKMSSIEFMDNSTFQPPQKPTPPKRRWNRRTNLKAQKNTPNVGGIPQRPPQMSSPIEDILQDNSPRKNSKGYTLHPLHHEPTIGRSLEEYEVGRDDVVRTPPASVTKLDPMIRPTRPPPRAESTRNIDNDATNVQSEKVVLGDSNLIVEDVEDFEVEEPELAMKSSEIEPAYF